MLYPVLFQDEMNIENGEDFSMKKKENLITKIVVFWLVVLDLIVVIIASLDNPTLLLITCFGTNIIFTFIMLFVIKV